MLFLSTVQCCFRIGSWASKPEPEIAATDSRGTN